MGIPRYTDSPAFRGQVRMRGYFIDPLEPGEPAHNPLNLETTELSTVGAGR